MKCPVLFSLQNKKVKMSSAANLFGTLIRFNLETPKRVIANKADSDKIPQNAASDQCLHCFQIV